MVAFDWPPVDRRGHRTQDTGREKQRQIAAAAVSALCWQRYCYSSVYSAGCCDPLFLHQCVAADRAVTLLAQSPAGSPRHTQHKYRVCILTSVTDMLRHSVLVSKPHEGDWQLLHRQQYGESCMGAEQVEACAQAVHTSLLMQRCSAAAHLIRSCSRVFWTMCPTSLYRVSLTFVAHPHRSCRRQWQLTSSIAGLAERAAQRRRGAPSGHGYWLLTCSSTSAIAISSRSTS